jgi:hypothetical protein
LTVDSLHGAVHFEHGHIFVSVDLIAGWVAQESRLALIPGEMRRGGDEGMDGRVVTRLKN